MRPKRRTNELSFILNPSPVHGVGVFATHDIEKGAKLRLFARDDRIRYLKDSSRRYPFIKRYGIPLDDGYYVCPSDFGRMSIGWYLNHSSAPNAFHKNYVYYAKKNIRSGEEITIDYETL